MSGGFNTSLGLSRGIGYGANATNQVGGTVVTAPVANNTKGAWTQIGANTSSDTTSIYLQAAYAQGSTGALDFAAALDIGVGPSGSQQVLIGNVNFSTGNTGSTNNLTCYNNIFPLSITANNAIWARWASNATATTGTMNISLKTFDSQYAGNPTITKYDTIGANATVTGMGTTITAGAAVQSSWVQLGANTARDYYGFFAIFDSDGVGPTNTNYIINIGIGPSGSQKILVSNWTLYDIQFCTHNSPFFEIYIPANNAIWVQAAALNGGTQVMNLTLYGAY